MSDGAFSDRLSQLKARWESDPTSRVFLQLAEEYRHQGRVRDALAVLDKGLGEHPGYLSALVAKGRCHLEMGEGAAARTALERVVKQDPTQMVANKLLVRAYLETGDPERARERLDLYSLLNDSDPEIGDLRRQIKLMDRPKEQVPEDSPFDLGPASPPIPAAPAPVQAAPAAPIAPIAPIVPTAQMAPITPLDDIFDLGPKAAPAAPRRPAADEDIFGFEEPAPAPVAFTSPAPAETTAEPVFDLPMPEPTPEMTGLDEASVGDGDLFPGLTTRSNRHRYLESLESEGIFELGPVPEPASEVPPPLSVPAAFAMAPLAPPDLTPVEPPLPEVAPILEDPFDLAPAPAVEAPEPVLPVLEDSSWIEEAPAPLPTPLPDLAPLPEPVFGERSGPALPEIDDFEDPDWSPPPSQEPEPAATATLGELYLRQGHTAEAERIFRDVLEREPDNTGARAGLEQLGAVEMPAPEEIEEPLMPAMPEMPPAVALDARQLLSGFRSGGGTTARKIFLLNRYLERIRGSRNVS